MTSRAVALTLLVWSVLAQVATDVVAQGWDWDEFLMVCMGFAGVAYVVVDQKREKRLDDCAMDHEGRLRATEVRYFQLDERVGTLEAASSLDARIEALEKAQSTTETPKE